MPDLIDGRVKTSDYTKEELRLSMQKVFFAHKKSGERKVIYDYPTNTGKSGEHLRLTTLESVGFRENCACGGAGRILAAVRRKYVQPVADL